MAAEAPVQIPFVDLGRQHAPIMHELRAAFDRVVGASAFILGEEVEAFEREFADYCAVKHCVGVNSGTAALTIALKAAGIGAGDEVIVPAFTFIASALAVVHAGATPVFCDVDEGTALIDLASAESVVTERTAAVIPVHLYGQACDMDAVLAFADRHRLAVMEDAAQAHGATFRGQRVGSFGRAAAFSFYPSKNLGALGDGGAICTDDDDLADRARSLRHLGQRGKGEHLLPGYNERLDGLQAALLRVKLPHLDRWNDLRRASAHDYREALPQQLTLLVQCEDTPCIHHLFPVRVQNRDRLVALLADAGVSTGVHYAPAVHLQPPFSDSGAARTGYPEAEAWAAEELSLPMFEGLTSMEVQRVATLCTSLLG